MAVGTPSSLSTLSATALRKVAYDSRFKVENVLPSVFTSLKTSLKIDKNEINVLQNGILMDVTNVGKAALGQSVVVSMRLGPRLKAKYGTDTLLGNEDEQALRTCTLYYNEIKKALKFYKKGYTHNDTEYLNFVETQGPALALFMAELFDARCQHALLMSYGPELVSAPVSKALLFNCNWAIPNLAESSYPAWENTAETITLGAADSDEYYSSAIYGTGGNAMSENIADALISAGGVAATSKALMKNDWVAQFSYYLAQVLRMEHIMIDGIPTIIVAVHPLVKSWMMNEDNTGSPASSFYLIADYKDPKRITLPGEIGRLYENLLFVTNHRAPTLTLTGDNGTWALKPGYMWPSNNDDRNHSAWAVTSGAQNFNWLMCFALGANALAKYTRDDLETNLSESTEYGFIQGLAAYLGEGIQLPRWVKDSETDGALSSRTMVQHGSCCIPVSWAPIGTVA